MATISTVGRPDDLDRPPLNALVTKPVLIRAGVVAGTLGSLLTAANQSDALFGPAAIDWLGLAQVFITPFVVVTLSQVLAIGRAKRDLSMETVARPAERFVATLFAHGIPKRAIAVALIIGLANTAIAVSASRFGAGDPSAVPVGLLVQAFSLPLAFGLLSQTISYRRVLIQAAGSTARSTGSARRTAPSQNSDE